MALPLESWGSNCRVGGASRLGVGPDARNGRARARGTHGALTQVAAAPAKSHSARTTVSWGASAQREAHGPDSCLATNKRYAVHAKWADRRKREAIRRLATFNAGSAGERHSWPELVQMMPRRQLERGLGSQSYLFSSKWAEAYQTPAAALARWTQAELAAPIWDRRRVGR